MSERNGSHLVRYAVDESVLSFEASRELGKALLKWAAERADRFVLNLDESVYSDPAAFIRIFETSFVEVKRHVGGSTTIAGAAPPANFADLVADRSLLSVSVSGDLTNVEDVILFIGDRRHYLAADYGRTQVLLMARAEIPQLRSLLRDADQDESVLKEFPLD